jgi:hypothetical protein
MNGKASRGHRSSTHGLSGRAVFPGDPGYDQARMNYNLRFDVHPRAIVFCRRRRDVSNAIRWARQEELPIAVRSGRHSYEAFSLSKGIVIDVSEMDEIRVDEENRLAVVGAGATLLPIYEALWKKRHTLPAGSCPTVGIAGLTLGGGFGVLSRLMGLTCDNLLRVTMVDARGRTITATDAHNADLLWACRGGGGGSFGIVTSFTFRIHPIGDVASYRMDWAWERMEPVLEAWQPWAPIVDDRLTSILKLNARSTGRISSVGLFVGGKDDLLAVLEPFRATIPPRELTIDEVPYIEAVRRFAGLDARRPRWQTHWHAELATRFKNSSHYAYEPIGPAGIATLRRYLARAPSEDAIAQLDAYGGAVNRVPHEATAFPHRAGTQYNIQYQTYWRHDAEARKNIRWIDNFRSAMRPHVAHAAYFGYADRAIEGWQHAYWGLNFDRLMAIKTKYDPEDVFNHGQSIPVARLQTSDQRRAPSRT